jgi:hypothetical protein
VTEPRPIKSRSARLAETLLRDRAERRAQQIVRQHRQVPVGRIEFDPFKPAHYRVIAGGDPGYLPKAPMRRTADGWLVTCSDCGERYRSQGLKHHSCNPKPKRMGRPCAVPGCEGRLSRYARADALRCDACRKAGRKAGKLPLDVPPEKLTLRPPERPVNGSLVIGPRTMPPILRSLPEWFCADCPVVEVDAVHVVRLGANTIPGQSPTSCGGSERKVVTSVPPNVYSPSRLSPAAAVPQEAFCSEEESCAQQITSSASIPQPNQWAR